jgi:hypothetical protein
MYCFDLFAILSFSSFNIIQRLQVYQELGASIQEEPDFNSSFSCDATVPCDDLPEPLSGIIDL